MVIVERYIQDEGFAQSILFSYFVAIDLPSTSALTVA
jgi:hypothetical protein